MPHELRENRLRSKVAMESQWICAENREFTTWSKVRQTTKFGLMKRCLNRETETVHDHTGWFFEMVSKLQSDDHRARENE